MYLLSNRHSAGMRLVTCSHLRVEMEMYAGSVIVYINISNMSCIIYEVKMFHVRGRSMNPGESFQGTDKHGLPRQVYRVTPTTDIVTRSFNLVVQKWNALLTMECIMIYR